MNLLTEVSSEQQQFSNNAFALQSRPLWLHVSADFAEGAYSLLVHDYEPPHCGEIAQLPLEMLLVSEVTFGDETHEGAKGERLRMLISELNDGIEHRAAWLEAVAARLRAMKRPVLVGEK